MEINIPKTSAVFGALLRADFTTQWRNRRSFILVLIVPVIILISWKSLVDRLGGPFVLANCLTLGLTAIGLMGYTNSIARDRDKGVFQRLRVAPVPSWSIMMSRLTVQMIMILLITLLVFYTGYSYDNIKISPSGYAFTFIVAMVGGAVYLSLGQIIVGRIKNPEAVNSTTRLVYFVFVMVGLVGESGLFENKSLTQIIRWSPYGTVQTILSHSLVPATWSSTTTEALFATVGYAVVFATLGIKWFKWDTK